MKPAVEPFRRALNKLQIQDPVISVYANIDGRKYNNAEHIRRLLPNQVSTYLQSCNIYKKFFKTKCNTRLRVKSVGLHIEIAPLWKT